MKHALSITRQQLDGLIEPWQFAGLIADLPLMDGVSFSARPVSVTLLSEVHHAGETQRREKGTPGWLLRQRLDHGDMRALVFDLDGNVLADHQNRSTLSMSSWITRRTMKR